MVHDCGERRSEDFAGHNRFVGWKGFPDVVVEMVVMLHPEVKREVGAGPNQKNSCGGNQESGAVHRVRRGVKLILKRARAGAKLYRGESQDAALKGIAELILSSSREVPSCFRIGSIARVKNTRGLIPPP